LRGHLSYKTTFFFSQWWPVNTGLTVYIFKFNNSRVIVFQYAKKKVPKFKKSHSADDQSQQHFPDPKTKGRDTVGKIYLISVGKKWNVKNSL
jgi:hypothetical protein